MAAPRLTRKDLLAALPEMNGSVALPGLDSAVEIFRDEWGIPHVRAGSVHDAFAGQGFVHAQDRLWQMDYDRHRAQGRWAELAGSAGLKQDLLMRRFRLEASARTDYERGINAETRAMLDAYAEGVNAFLQAATSSGRLPIEYRLLGETPDPWRPWDSLLVFKVRHLSMGVWEWKVWRARLLNQAGPEVAARLVPGYVPGWPLILPPGAPYEGMPPEGLSILEKLAGLMAQVPALGGELESGDDAEGGSNSWAVHGTRSASGKPLVAGDPHRPLDVPNAYYQNHVACPEFDAVGLSFAGVPGFPHFGHNASAVWCVTHARGDYQDLFVEQFDPRDPTRYRAPEGWRPAERYREVIQVRGAAPVEIEVTATHHGPIVLGEPSDRYAVAFRYTATAEPNSGFDALLLMLRAGSAAEVEEAMRVWVDPANNFVTADTAGNIAYRTRGQIPIRSVENRWLPVPGWTGDHEWQGNIPFEEMPALRNPEEGFIATANNRIVGDAYPRYLGLEPAQGFRAQRIVERLRSATGLTPDDMAALHADRISIPGRIFARLLAGIEPLDDDSARARDLLVAWDGAMERDSQAALVYSAFREQLLRDLMSPLLGPLVEVAFSGSGGPPNHMARIRAHLAEMALRDDRSLLPDDATWKGVMEVALQRAIQGLREQLGEAPSLWRWNRLHRTRPIHPLSPLFPEAVELLDPPSAGMGGDADTVAAAGFTPGGGSFTVTGTSVARYVFDLSDWNRCRWIVPLGASGHPGSPHYADQVAAWSEHRLVPMLYDWEGIRVSAESHQTLVPSPTR